MSLPSAERDPIEELADSFLCRYRAGERPAAEEYIARYPELADQVRDILSALVLMEQNPPAGGRGSAPAAGQADLTGRHLGDYRIVQEIGRGGMGVVYEAVQESLGRHVALKVLPAGMDTAGQFLERFRREAKAAAGLHHTNIVPVFGVGEHQGTHFYAMEFIRGRGLDGVLEEVRQRRQHRAAAAVFPPPGPAKSTPGLPSAEATPVPSGVPDSPRTEAPSELADLPPGPYFRAVAQLGVQAADGLHHAHQHGVLHRDVKPSNLLLDARGTVWITDFGLAKTTGGDDLTATGDLVGTLRYMAPERFRGEADARSDVYALGATLYELLTLRPAYADADRLRLIEHIQRADRPGPRQVEPRLPRDLETIVLKAMAPAPAERYASARALAEDLERFHRGEPIRARRSSWWEHTRKWAQRRPAVAALLGALAATVLTSLVGLTYLWLQARQERQRAEQHLAQARAAEAGTEAINRFLTEKLLAAPQPGKQGRDVTMREVVDAAAAQIDEVFEGQPELEATVRQTIAETYIGLGSYAEAELQLRKTLAIRRGHLGPDDGRTLNAVSSLAAALYAQDKLADAEPLFRANWESRHRLFGPEHPNTLAADIGMALVLLERGKLLECEQVSREALEASRRVLGPEHPDTLLFESHQGLVLTKLDRLGEAEQLLRRSLDAHRRIRGSNHPQTLRVVHSLANLLLVGGKRVEAEQLLRGNLEACRRILGPDHPDTLQTEGLLGRLLAEDAKRLGEGEQRLRQNLEALRRTLGSDHRLTLAAGTNLGYCLRRQGRLDEAEPLLRQTLEGFRRVLGADHPETLQVAVILALLLQGRGDPVEADKLLHPLLQSFRRVLGSDHTLTLDATFHVASFLRDLDRQAEAEALVRQNLDSYRRKLGPDHPSTLIATNSLGIVLAEQGKRTEAEPLFRQSLGGRRRVYGREHPSTLTALHSLAKLVDAQGRHDEAEVMFREALVLRRKVLPAGHADIAFNLVGLGTLLLETGRSQEAEPLLREALGIRQKAPATLSWQTAEAEGVLGACLTAQGRYAEAEPLLLHSYQTMGKAKRPPPATVRKTVDYLVQLYDAWGKPAEASEWRRRRDSASDQSTGPAGKR
jgi:serine/threonine protein kinase/Tfp pilus assembly protein PilF